MIVWVPYLLSAFFEEVGGVMARREILADAGLDPEMPFRIDASYADAHCRQMLDVACVRFGITETEAFEQFAPFFLARSRAMFPGFFLHRPTGRAFLLRQPEVHNTLAAGLQEGQRTHVAGKFRKEAIPEGVRVFYRSPNRLAGLYAAVARCLGEEFGQSAHVRFEVGGPGDAECIMVVEINDDPSRVAA